MGIQYCLKKTGHLLKPRDKYYFARALGKEEQTENLSVQIHYGYILKQNFVTSLFNVWGSRVDNFKEI